MAKILLEPSSRSKIIPLSFDLNDTSASNAAQLMTKRQFNTADTDAWFEVNLEGFVDTSGSFDITLFNLNDKSVFNHTGKPFTTNPFYYKLDSESDETTNEIRHAGRWIGQIVVTLANGNSATRKFIFDIEGHILDGADVQTILLEDYNALIATINTSKDLLAQYNVDYAALLVDLAAAETARTATYNQLVADQQANIDAFDVALDDGIVAANLATKLQTFEATNNSRLLSAEQQLADNADKSKVNSTYYSQPKTPTVTFVDDDGHVDVINRLLPIFNTKGIKGCCAIITGAIGGPSIMTSAQLDLLHSSGWEFLGHGRNYTANLLEFPVDADLEYQLGDGCKGDLESRGYKINGFVYPQNYSDVRIRRFTKKYYDFALTGLGVNTGEFLDTTRIKRIAFGSWTASNPTVNGNAEKNTLAYYKACVDYAVTNNQWLIFMTHIGQQDAAQDLILSDLIDYIKTIGVKVATATEGYKAFGNKVFVGDKDTDYLAINETGLYSNSLYPTRKLLMNSKLLTDGIGTYKEGISTMITNYAFASANGYPLNTHGILITYRFSMEYAVYNKQEYLVNTSNKKYVRYAITDTTWSAFEEVLTSASYPYKVATMNAYVAADPITAYPANSVTTFAVNYAGGLGFAPTQSPGLVTVYRIGGNGWDRREFRKHNTNEIYASYTDGTTGAWSTPVKVSAV